MHRGQHLLALEIGLEQVEEHGLAAEARQGVLRGESEHLDCRGRRPECDKEVGVEDGLFQRRRGVPWHLAADLFLEELASAAR